MKVSVDRLLVGVTFLNRFLKRSVLQMKDLIAAPTRSTRKPHAV